MTKQEAIEKINALQNAANKFTNISEADITRFMKLNPMCYNCKKLYNNCTGETNKLYSGCIFKK